MGCLPGKILSDTQSLNAAPSPYILLIIADIPVFFKSFSGVFIFFIIFVKNDIKIWKIFFSKPIAFFEKMCYNRDKSETGHNCAL